MTKTRAFHEDFGRGDGPKAGSERGFGIVFAVVFAVIGFWPLLDGEAARIWALTVGAVFLAASLLAPGVLKPLNRVWFLFGMALGRVVNPLVMGLLFYGTITPIALVMRLAGKDPLRLGFDPDAKTYWIDREPPGPAPESMRNQF